MTRKYPFGWTLSAITAVCALFWWATILFPLWVGAIAAILGSATGALLLVIEIRKAFTYGSRYAADFVAGRTQRCKLAENPLLRDPFYQSLAIQIEEAKAKHRPVRHLYAKRDHRVRELLATYRMPIRGRK